MAFLVIWMLLEKSNQTIEIFLEYHWLLFQVKVIENSITAKLFTNNYEKIFLNYDFSSNITQDLSKNCRRTFFMKNPGRLHQV